MNDKQLKFVEQVASLLQKYAPQYEIECISGPLAQAILESSWGTSELGIKAHNYFGIKYNKACPNRCPSAIGTYEKVGFEQNKAGDYKYSKMNWQKFPNMDAGVKGYFDFLNYTNRYNNLKGVKEPKKYLTLIKQDGYATSISYVENLMKVINTYNLTKYDNYTKESETKMSNSKLVDYKKLSPDDGGKRTHTIDRISPHCVVGQLSAEGIASCFSRKHAVGGRVSTNYGIGKDGRVALIIPEDHRAFCTSSPENDQRAVTIEVASDMKHPYAFKPAAYNKLIDLCEDICRRNGKKKLIWISNKQKALAYKPKADEMLLTIHRWFANKACPGDWLVARLDDLAETVTKRLGGEVKKNAESQPKKTTTQTSSSTKQSSAFKVQVTSKALNIRKSASMDADIVGIIKDQGIYTIVEKKNGFGRLKSGMGWIALSFTKKIN